MRLGGIVRVSYSCGVLTEGPKAKKLLGILSKFLFSGRVLGDLEGDIFRVSAGPGDLVVLCGQGAFRVGCLVVVGE